MWESIIMEAPTLEQSQAPTPYISNSDFTFRYNGALLGLLASTSERKDMKSPTPLEPFRISREIQAKACDNETTASVGFARGY
jgi:hypothetical protein